MLNVEPVRESEGVGTKPAAISHFQLFSGFLTYQLSN